MTWRRMASRSPAMLAAVLAVMLPAAALAVQPDEVLSDPSLEARARAISAGLRCLVCQNQSIDDSDAPLAKDLRILVRERLEAGDSDTEVRAYVVDRYGDFVLLRPPVALKTLLLWIAPLLVLAGGIAMARRAFKRPAASAAAAPLSAAEERELGRILARDAGAEKPDVE